MSERLVSYLRANLVDAGRDWLPYEVMSDEEMAAIDAGADSDLLVRPWIESQDDVDASLAARFGERSLLLRGLLEVDTEGEEPSIAISDQLQFVADTRRLGAGHIVAKSSSQGERRARYYTLQPQVGAFEEEIDSEGYHLFSACTYAAAMSRLANWALPGVGHRGREMRTRVEAEHWGAWLANEFGIDAALTEINLLLPGYGESAEPESWFVASAHGAGVLGIRKGETIHAASVTTDQLEARLTGRISQSLGVPA